MTDKPWVANKPEQRLSIAVARFLERALVGPCYITANQDADGGGRSQNQRSRDKNRGIFAGQLDWEVEQGPPHLMRRVELKRGKNQLTDHQEHTIKKLTACGAPPIVAWDLRAVYDGLAEAGFRFAANVHVTLQHLEAEMAGWDREAEDVKSGAVVRKASTRAPRAPRDSGGIRAAAKARQRGIFI
jgi:hypothetical protein